MNVLYYLTISLVAIAPVVPGKEPVPVTRSTATIRISDLTLEECEKVKVKTQITTSMHVVFADCRAVELK